MIHSYDKDDTESALKFIEDITSDAKQIQDKVLEEILSHNANTEYLQQFLHGLSDKLSFKNKLPLATYEDVKPYIDRIANGEPSNLICYQPITKLLTSSGTSGGVRKRLPLTDHDMKNRSIHGNLVTHVTKRYINGFEDEDGKGLMIMFNSQEIKTPSGILSTPSSANYLRSSYFRDRPLNWFSAFTCPDDIIMCLDDKQSLYCQLLCGLVRKDETLWCGAPFASTFIRAIKFLETNWKELCSNIRTGRVSDWIDNSDCRTAMDSVLSGPFPDLADTIERELSQISWEGIIGKLWPRAKFIRTIVTGTMVQYVPILNFYSGGLPIVSGLYACSEGLFGINLDPFCEPRDVIYTLVPFTAYYEFLPVDEIETEIENQDCVRDEDRLVSVIDVKVDCSYELVVTTYTGLYRYKLGDIVTVTSFHNNTPQFKFMQRQGEVLSIDADKTSEDDLFKAMERAKKKLETLDFMLIDYTSYSDLSSIPGHYVLFWELIAKDGKQMPKLDPETIEDCCFVLEDSFDFCYKKYRSDEYKSIGPLEIRVVTQGTFDLLTDFFVSRGTSVSQYKTPRGIRSEEALKLLDCKVVESFFSGKAPPIVALPYQP